MSIRDICRELKLEATPRGQELVDELLEAIIAELDNIQNNLRK